MLGLDDRHLDFRILLRRHPAQGVSRYRLTTLVGWHNLFGRGHLFLTTSLFKWNGKSVLTNALWSCQRSNLLQTGLAAPQGTVRGPHRRPGEDTSAAWRFRALESFGRRAEFRIHQQRDREPGVVPCATQMPSPSLSRRCKRSSMQCVLAFRWPMARIGAQSIEKPITCSPASSLKRLALAKSQSPEVLSNHMEPSSHDAALLARRLAGLTSSRGILVARLQFERQTSKLPSAWQLRAV